MAMRRSQLEVRALGSWSKWGVACAVRQDIQCPRMLGLRLMLARVASNGRPSLLFLGAGPVTAAVADGAIHPDPRFRALG